MVIRARWIWWPGGRLYRPNQGCVAISPDGVERVSTTLTGFSHVPSVIELPWGYPRQIRAKSRSDPCAPENLDRCHDFYQKLAERADSRRREGM